MIIYKTNTSDISALLDHFHSCDPGFIKELERKVNLAAYSEKLVDKAVRHEAWNGQHLAGLVAIYHNAETGLGFITDVSVSESCLNQGIASRLLQDAINAARKINLDAVQLEVSKANQAAIKLYQKFGFINEREDSKSLWMKLPLK